MLVAAYNKNIYMLIENFTFKDEMNPKKMFKWRGVMEL